jgi:hypothetical protein
MIAAPSARARGDQSRSIVHSFAFGAEYLLYGAAAICGTLLEVALSLFFGHLGVPFGHFEAQSVDILAIENHALFLLA